MDSVNARNVRIRNQTLPIIMEMIFQAQIPTIYVGTFWFFKDNSHYDILCRGEVSPRAAIAYAAPPSAGLCPATPRISAFPLSL